MSDKQATEGDITHEDITHLIHILIGLLYPSPRLGGATERYYHQFVTRAAEQRNCRERDLVALMQDDEIRRTWAP